MKQRLPAILVFLYLLSCIVLGGSAQNPWPNLLLQLSGIAAIAWAALVVRRSTNFALYALILGALTVVLLQLVPLPAGLWTQLPGRQAIEEGLSALGHAPRWFSVSEMPSQSVLTLFAAIPATAAFVMVERLAISRRYVAASIVGGMIAAIFVGAVQVAGGPNSGAYFYEIHSFGAIGFFANSNHMGTLLLVGIPMAAALTASVKSTQGVPPIASYGMGVTVLLVVFIGIVLNGSRAAIGLSLPVLIASAALFPAAVRWRGFAGILSATALCIGLAAIFAIPMRSNDVSLSQGTPTNRQVIWEKAVEATADNFPTGTGLGTFDHVYNKYEDSADVTTSYVNHAHNDYLEITLELGAFGIALIALFMCWWAIAAWRIWNSHDGTAVGRAATIATAAILAHSVVDFPLRTAAISAIFGACVALMASDRGHAADAASEKSKRVRHLILG